LGGQNGSRRATRLALTASESICRIFNVYDLYEGPSRQFDALLVRLHQQSMLIFVTIAHPKMFESFQRRRGSSRCILSSDSSSLAYWNLRWTILKPYILPQCHKRLISKEPNYFCCWALSAKAFDARLFDYSALGFNITTILRILWLFTKALGFLGC